MFEQDPHKAQLEELLEAITSVEQAKGSCLVKCAEQKLFFCKKYPQYFDLLLQIIALPQLSFNVRKLTSVFIFVYMRSRKQKSGFQEKRDMVRRVIECFRMPQIDFSIRMILTTPCSSMIAKQASNILQREIAQTLHTVLSTLSDDAQAWQNAILLSVTLFKSFRSHSDSKFLAFKQQHLLLSIKYQEYLNYSIELKSSLELQVIIQSIKQLILVVQYYLVMVKEQFTSPSIIGQNTANLSTLFNLLKNGLMITQKTVVNPLFWIQSNNRAIVQKFNELRVNYFILLITTIKQIPAQHFNRNQQYSFIIQEITDSTVNHLQVIFLSQNPHLSACPNIEQVVQHEIMFLIVLGYNPTLSGLVHQRYIELLKVIKEMLTFSQKDLQQFKNTPVQFINNLIKFIDNKYSQPNSQSLEFITFDQASNLDLEDLKVLSVKLFKTILKIQPKLVLQIVSDVHKYICENINNQNHNLELILIINLIRRQVQKNKQISKSLCDIILGIGHRQPPLQKNTTVYQHFQYTLSLVTISSYIDMINKLWPEMCSEILDLALELVSNQDYSSSVRLMGELLVQDIVGLYQNNTNLTEKIITFSNINIQKNINENKLTNNLIDILFFIMQHLVASQLLTDFFSKSKQQLLDSTLNLMCYCVQTYINKKTEQSKTTINKCWNIVRVIGQNSTLLQKLIMSFENIISRLLFYLQNNKQLDFEEDCFILMTSFIKYSYQVSEFVAEIFKLIPEMFYNSYQGTFGQAFQALQMLLYYGSLQFFQEHKDIPRSIIQMCIFSMMKKQSTDSIEGILLLQSLLLSAVFVNQQEWRYIKDQIELKMKQKTESNFLMWSLIGLLGICLRRADKTWVEPYQLYNFIKIALRQIGKCTDDYCFKVIMFTCCEFILKYKFKYIIKSSSDLRIILHSLTNSEYSSRQSRKNEDKQVYVLKVCTVSFLTKTSLTKYRSYFFTQITQKLNRSSHEYEEIREQIDEAIKNLRSEDMEDQIQRKRIDKYK